MNISVNNKRLRRAVFTLLLMSALVDTLNGFFDYYNYKLPISILVKSVCALLAFCFLGRNERVVLIFATLIYSLSLSYISVFHNLSSLDVYWIFKNLSLLIFVMFFFQTLRSDIDLYWFQLGKKIIGLSFVIFFINLALSYTGYGRAQYSFGDVRVGGLGFIIAGNEMTIAMLSCFSILIYSNRNSALINRIGFYSFSFTAFFMKSTKSGVFGSVIIMLSQELLKTKGFKKIFILIASSVIFIYLIKIWVSSGVIERYSYFLYSDGFVSAITGSRSRWLIEVINSAIVDYDFFDFIFGRGGAYIESITYKPSIEIDPFDFFFSYGIIGLFVCFFPFFYPLINTKIHWSKLSIYFSVGLIFALSFFSGHILNGGICTPYVAYLLAYAGINQVSET